MEDRGRERERERESVGVWERVCGKKSGGRECGRAWKRVWE